MGRLNLVALTAVAVVGSMLLDGVALARPSGPPLHRPRASVLQQQMVYEYSYDDQGRILRQDGTIYSGDAEVLGTAVIVYTRGERGRMQQVVRSQYDAEGLLRGTHTTDYVYEDGHQVGMDSLRTDADGLQVTRTRTRYHVQVRGVGRVTETRVYNGGDELQEVRYLIVDRDARGRTVSRDISAYDPLNVQLRRSLTRYTHGEHGISREERWLFDADDQITRREVGVHSIVDRTHERWDWDVFGGDGEVRGYREIDLTRGARGRVRSTVTTHFDANGLATVTMEEHLAYDPDGHLRARRSHIETY